MSTMSTMPKTVLGRVFNMTDRGFQNAEKVWNSLTGQLNRGNSNRMVFIQGMVFAALDCEQIEYILLNFQ